MKYTNKRIISGLIAAAMVLTTIPSSSFDVYGTEVSSSYKKAIVKFKPLPQDIAFQNIELKEGKSIDMVAILPDNLEVYETGDETAFTIIKNIDWKVKNKEKNNGEETWIYIPNIPREYKVANNVQLPQIRATIKGGNNRQNVYSKDVQSEGRQAKYRQSVQGKQMPALTEVTVSNTSQFMNAIQTGNKRINVTGIITLGDKADTDKRMLPVVFKENTEIIGKNGGQLVFRSPIQLEGNNVLFKNISMHFESSNALNSVPHREIFLAGYSLKLDNVHTYLKGGEGALGGLGGTEKELLPTVYAGAYPKTDNSKMGTHAQLTVENSNSNTIFQAINLSNDTENGTYKEYTGESTLNIGPVASVRDGVNAKNSSKATINMIGTASGTNTARVNKFIGNNQTTLNLDNINLTNAEIDNINAINLTNNALFMPKSSEFNNINVAQGTTFDLSTAGNVVVNGNFDGGGTLRLSNDNSVTINGNVTGKTTISAWGTLTTGKPYILSKKDNNGEFELDTNLANTYKLAKEGNNWVLYFNNVGGLIELGSIKVVSRPTTIDLNSIESSEFDGASKYKKELFEIICIDKKQNIISPFDAKENSLIYDTVGIKTEYWTSNSYDNEKDWSNYLGLAYEDDDTESNKYYLTLTESPKEGDYTMLILKEEVDLSAPDLTVAQVKEAVKDKIVDTLDFTFYRSSTDSVKKDIGSGSIGTIQEQTYTGGQIAPDITVTFEGTTLTKGKDYVVNYKNNTNIGEAIVEVIGIGSYTGKLEKTFNIVKSDAEFTLTADKETAVYGDTIKFTFEAKAKPKARRRSRSIKENYVSLYSGNNLLGTAKVDSYGRASLSYNTNDKKISIGESPISVVFGGSDTLNSNTNAVEVLNIVLKKQAIDLNGQGVTVSLNNLVYDGTNNITDIQNVTLADGTTFPVIGKAQLSSADAGEYNKAVIKSIQLSGDEVNWYEFTSPENKEVNVSPKVNIHKATAPMVEIIQKVIKKGENGNIVLSDYVPQNIKEPVYSISPANGTKVNLTLTDSNIGYTANNEGEETFTVTVESKNYKNITITVNFNITNKDVVDIGLKAPDKVYDGNAYNGLQIEKPLNESTISYYDLTEQKNLSSEPKDVGEYSVTVKFNGSTQVGTETKNFRIIPKEVHIRAIDHQIKTGAPIPKFDNPQQGRDYNFEAGYEPIQGESIGEIRMGYKDIPNSSQVGNYSILLQIIGNNKNYNPVAIPGTLKIIKDGNSGNSNSGGNSSNNNSSNNNSSSGGSGSSGSSSNSNSNSNNNNSNNSNNNNANTNTNKNINTNTGNKQPVREEISSIKVDNRGVVLIDKQAINDAIKNAQKQNKDDITVVVPVEIVNNENLSIEISKATLDSLVKADAKLEINSDNSINIAFNADTLKYLSKDNSDGELMVRTYKQPQVSEKVEKIINNRPVYDIKLSWVKDDKETNISDLKSNEVKVSLPYKSTIGEIHQNLRVVYIDDNGEMHWIDNSSYNDDKGVVEFTTNHFSVYAVGYKADVPTFNDITDHWAEKYITAITQLGLFKGTTENQFSPEEHMTRGMFVTVLGRLASADNTLGDTHFIDVPKDAYYAGYVQWAVENGIVKGISENTFEPNRMITRQEMAVMIKNFIDKFGYNIELNKKELPFNDNNKISNWAVEKVHFMKQAGIISGKGDNCFKPFDTATRAEVSVVIHNLIEKIKN